jgi:hypothetical protein
MREEGFFLFNIYFFFFFFVIFLIKSLYQWYVEDLDGAKKNVTEGEGNVVVESVFISSPVHTSPPSSSPPIQTFGKSLTGLTFGGGPVPSSPIRPSSTSRSISPRGSSSPSVVKEQSPSPSVAKEQSLSPSQTNLSKSKQKLSSLSGATSSLWKMLEFEDSVLFVPNLQCVGKRGLFC